MANSGRHRTPLQLAPAVAACAAVLSVAATAALIAAGATTALRPDTPPADRDASGTTAPTPAADPPAPAALRTAEPKPSKPRRTEAVTPATDLATWLEDQVIVLVNRERARAGCDRLRTDERIRTAARRHSTDMAEYDFFGHTGHDGRDFVARLAAAGYPRAEAAGENIAYGYPNPQSVVEAWMASSAHRTNILNCDAEAVATGLAYRGRSPYWTQDFGYR